RFLQRAHLADFSQAFDRVDSATVGLHREQQAGSRAVAIDRYGAGTADAMLAADMRAGEAERMAQKIGKQQARLDCALIGNIVDDHGDIARFIHAAASFARTQAAATALPASTPAICRR